MDGTEVVARILMDGNEITTPGYETQTAALRAEGDELVAHVRFVFTDNPKFDTVEWSFDGAPLYLEDFKYSGPMRSLGRGIVVDLANGAVDGL
jgi:hypothetical protein